jgi:hypothetical protein
MLPDGRVLIAGGYANGARLSSVELYNTATGNWITNKPLSGARNSHTAILLPNGRILVAGGVSDSNVLSGAELYDTGLNFKASDQPQILSTPAPLKLGSPLNLTGSGFRGISGASCGNSQDSPTDYPIVQLHSIEGGQTIFLLVTNWSTNSLVSVPLTNLIPGYALITLFVNGIPSTSSVVNVSLPIAATTLTSPTLTNGSFQFSFTNTPGALFSVFASTNMTLPLDNWTVLGGVTEPSPGHFQFIDPAAATGLQRFYRIGSF